MSNVQDLRIIFLATSIVVGNGRAGFQIAKFRMGAIAKGCSATGFTLTQKGVTGFFCDETFRANVQPLVRAITKRLGF